MQGVLPRRQVNVTPDELAAAETLMDAFGSLTEDDVRDRYREELDELAGAKLAERAPQFNIREAPPTGPVVDLMAALQESVSNARASRGEGKKPGLSPLPGPAAKTTKKSPTTPSRSTSKTPRTTAKASGKKATETAKKTGRHPSG